MNNPEWKIKLEQLKEKLEERRLQRLQQPTIAPPKKETRCPQIKKPGCYQTLTLEEKQTLKYQIKLSREKINSKKDAENKMY